MCFFDIYLSPIVINALRECVQMHGTVLIIMIVLCSWLVGLTAEPFCLHQFELLFYTPIRVLEYKFPNHTTTPLPPISLLNTSRREIRMCFLNSLAFFSIWHIEIYYQHWKRVNHTQTKSSSAIVRRS